MYHAICRIQAVGLAVLALDRFRHNRYPPAGWLPFLAVLVMMRYVFSFLMLSVPVCAAVSGGCQSAPHANWLTPPKTSAAVFRGQAPFGDPWGIGTPSPPVNNADDQQSQAEEEQLKTLANTPQAGMPKYMQPFRPWNGPFENRVKSKNFEQEIIRQVGYEQTASRLQSSEPAYDWEKEEKKEGFDWSILDPVNFFKKTRDWMGMGPDEKKANASLAKGREVLLSNPDLKDKKKCLEAAGFFVEAANRYPDSVIEEDALHLAGECYFFADDYPNAFTMYQKLVIKYQHSKYMDSDVRRIFKIARYWEAESVKSMSFNFSNKTLPRYDTWGFSKKAYETIFINDPNGPVSDDALMALATAYLARGRYQGDDNFNQAAYYYQRLREEYPLSKHITKAYENELYARTHAYLGAEHPRKTLDEAEKLAGITLQQFSGELNTEQKEELLGLKEQLSAKKAEQLWTLGRFYDTKKRHYGSAKLCYEQLIAEYPQTEFAEKARKRREQIKDLPDVPPLFGFPINPFKAEEF